MGIPGFENSLKVDVGFRPLHAFFIFFVRTVLKTVTKTSIHFVIFLQFIRNLYLVYIKLQLQQYIASMIVNYLVINLIFMCFVFTSRSQQKVLRYQILSKGQAIEIPLQQHFQYANVSKINEKKSSQNYKQIFSIRNTSSQPYRTVFNLSMQFVDGNKTIRFNQTDYCSSKSLYNQPIKLYLLSNNYLMMVIYKQTCGGQTNTASQDKNTVIGLNLTAMLPTNFTKNKVIVCNAMETQSTTFRDLVYVVCKTMQQNKSHQFFIVKVELIHNIQGFISGLSYSNYTLVGNKTSSCQDYSLKYFDLLRVGQQSYSSWIFMYCKKKVDNTSNQVYYFYDPQIQINSKLRGSLSDCLINSTYIGPNDNGFISVKNNRVYQYFTNATNGTRAIPVCQATSLESIEYLFSASRNYNNIQMTYFFLPNTTIVIKSSYRTNYQRLQLNRTGYNFTSYALTQHYLALTICNGYGVTVMLVYQMQDLYPRLIDERVIVNTGQPCNNFVLSSTNNYLERGYYVFFYNMSTNQISLMQYKGYILTIKPTGSPKSQLQQLGVNSANYTLFVEAQNNNISENLKIQIIIREFNNSRIQLLKYNKLKIDSPNINFNLSSLAVGPLQKFYFEPTNQDKNIHFQFVNYYNQINISYLIFSDNTHSQVGKVQKLKQIAINIQLKVTNPVISLFFHTFVQNCILIYEQTQFKMNCSSQNIIRYKSLIQFQQSKVIVLSKDKWIQYSKDILQYCTIVGQSGLCERLPFDFQQQSLRRVKLVKFELKSNSLPYIQLFILFSKSLHYGIFSPKNLSYNLTYTKIFSITKNQVQELVQSGVQLTNIHYDKNYNHYLLLHLSNLTTTTVKSFALLYDRPAKNDNGNFLGHLIKKFQDQKIEYIMTIDNFLVIINRQNGVAYINQYQITQIYSVYPTRSYPLYGRKIVQGGSHTADLEFVYIQVLIQKGQKAGKTQYLVYCPALRTTNILTHTLPKQSVLSFIQQIGSTKNKYPHSIGLNGNNLFALSIPNLMIKFNYDAKQNKCIHDISHKELQLYNKQDSIADSERTVIPGVIPLKLIDYQNVLYELSYEYEFDISAETINYNQKPEVLNISESNSESAYVLKIHQIQGPVMNIDFKIQGECEFIKKNFKFQDIITQSQCLIEIDSKKFGQILDIKSLHLSQSNTSVQLIVTTQHLICVQNHQIIRFFNISSKACAIVSYNNTMGRGLFVCDDGQGSIINMFYFLQSQKSCYGLIVNQNIKKPTWLVYQYFKMKYSMPYAIFQVPIRVQSNKIYFLTKFDLTTQNFQDKYQIFIQNNSNEIDHFSTKDFEIDSQYGYLLEDGLGIYDLDDFQLVNITNKTMVQPLAWLSNKNISQSLELDSQLVYIKPDEQMSFSEQAYKCKSTFNQYIYMQIGTKTHAYKIKICFNDNDDSKNIIQNYQIIPIIKFIQYKDCKNNQISKSITWSKYNLTIKLCVLQIQEHRIFSNYMPITSKTSEYYMQFYFFNPNGTTLQSINPFRMEKVSTNDQIQINVSQGELIVRSLFNFLCYYRLSSQIKWTLIRNQTNNVERRTCTGNVILKNQNFIKQYSLSIQNTDEIDQAYKPWIFRCFFIVLCSVSLMKYRYFIQSKNIKEKKLTYNLLSNQFEVQVRVNSKKSIEYIGNSQINIQSCSYKQFDS